MLGGNAHALANQAALPFTIEAEGINIGNILH